MDIDSVASAPSASANVASTSRTLSPRTNPATTRLSSVSVVLTSAPNIREAKASVVPRKRGVTVTGRAVVGQWPPRRGFRSAYHDAWAEGWVVNDEKTGRLWWRQEGLQVP
jgi:hypothetical protein